MIRGSITAKTRPAEIYQGEDSTLTITTSEDVSTATEIEFLIDAPTQISKTLGASQITSVTATGFTVQIDAADTSSIPEGGYKHQARVTIGSKLEHIRFTPNKIKIKDSVFVDDYTPGDYN